MCMFVTTVREVASTSIFANMRADAPGRWRQTLVYEARVGTAQENAMVLPIPVHREVGVAGIELLNLSSIPQLFAWLLALMPALPAYGAPREALGVGAPPLPVHRIGSFDVSIVPTLDDFARLSGIFKVGLGALLAVLEQRYADHAFVVYQIAPSTSLLHPFGVSFVTRYDHLFFPTLHVHDGSALAQAHFDHRLYAQRSRLPEAGRPPASSTWDKDRWAGAPFLDPFTRVESGVLRGMLVNQDTFVELAPDWLAEHSQHGGSLSSPAPLPPHQPAVFNPPLSAIPLPRELPPPPFDPNANPVSRCPRCGARLAGGVQCHICRHVLFEPPANASPRNPHAPPSMPPIVSASLPAVCPSCGWSTSPGEEPHCAMCGAVL